MTPEPMEQTNPPLVMWLIFASNLAMLILALFLPAQSVEKTHSIQDKDTPLCPAEVVTSSSQP